jgi:hypothetical protein
MTGKQKSLPLIDLGCHGMRIKLHHIAPIAMLATVIGCSPNNPADDVPETTLFQHSVTGRAVSLTQTEFNALTPEQQYRVANKLLGSMFKGISVNDFFDLSAGVTTLTPRDPDFLNTIATRLRIPLPPQDDVSPGEISIEEIVDAIGGTGSPTALFNFSDLEDGSPKEVALARTTQIPLSRDSFDHWVAYFLANTILFSPAEEIDSTSIYDVQSVYNRMVEQLEDDWSISEMIFRHENSQENWRRFRSPEDNTREMIEIYLGLFVPDDNNPDNAVVNASKACQNYYLTDDASEDPYRWVDNGNYNTETLQLILDQNEGGIPIISCSDFYSVIADHTLTIPRMVTVVVENLMGNRDGVVRAEMIQSISDAGPSTFQEIFAAVLFSKEYLLYTERAKSFEENYFNMAARLKYTLEADTFQDTATCQNMNNCDRRYLSNMNWPVMSNKLGRLAGVPIDTLSFAHYHRGLREGMIINSARYNNGLIDEPDNVEPNLTGDTQTGSSTVVTSMTNAEFLDYLFLTMLERRPDTEETNTLTPLMTANQEATAELIMDYISRLPEQYYFQCTKGIQMSTDPITSEVTLGECVQ